MVTTDQNQVKEKIIKVIDSCISENHFKSTENYIDFYYEMYGDELGYLQLKKVLEQKINE